MGEERISQVLLSGSVLQPLWRRSSAYPNVRLLRHPDGAVPPPAPWSLGRRWPGCGTGAGVGLAVLFKYNRHLKENLLLAGILYGSAVATGLVCGLLF